MSSKNLSLTKRNCLKLFELKNKKLWSMKKILLIFCNWKGRRRIFQDSILFHDEKKTKSTENFWEGLFQTLYFLLFRVLKNPWIYFMKWFLSFPSHGQTPKFSWKKFGLILQKQKGEKNPLHHDYMDVFLNFSNSLCIILFC